MIRVLVCPAQRDKPRSANCYRCSRTRTRFVQRIGRGSDERIVVPSDAVESEAGRSSDKTSGDLARGIIPSDRKESEACGDDGMLLNVVFDRVDQPLFVTTN